MAWKTKQDIWAYIQCMLSHLWPGSSMMHLMPHELMLICLITASWRKVGLHRVSRDCIIVHQTNVPVDEAIQVIHGKLQSDKTVILHGGQDYSLSWQGRRTAWGMPEVNLLQLRRGLPCAVRGLGCSNGFSSLCFCGEPVHGVFKELALSSAPAKLLRWKLDIKMWITPAVSWRRAQWKDSWGTSTAWDYLSSL